MATERNGDTVIKVYTANRPPEDDTEYIKRSARREEQMAPHKRIRRHMALAQAYGRGKAPCREAARTPRTPTHEPQTRAQSNRYIRAGMEHDKA